MCMWNTERHKDIIGSQKVWWSAAIRLLSCSQLHVWDKSDKQDHRRLLLCARLHFHHNNIHCLNTAWRRTPRPHKVFAAHEEAQSVHIFQLTIGSGFMRLWRAQFQFFPLSRGGGAHVADRKVCSSISWHLTSSHPVICACWHPIICLLKLHWPAPSSRCFPRCLQCSFFKAEFWHPSVIENKCVMHFGKAINIARAVSGVHQNLR